MSKESREVAQRSLLAALSVLSDLENSMEKVELACDCIRDALDQFVGYCRKELDLTDEDFKDERNTSSN